MSAVPLIIDPTSSLLFGPEVVILDASWLYDPNPPTRNAYEEFIAEPRFPNARFWDLDAVSEPHPDGYVLMLPSPERFAAFAGKHGIAKSSHVVVYDSEGIFSAPRTAWTFKVISLSLVGPPNDERIRR
jgi:thiosulfate/3-mercaptopyruvate sulfurtransferase